MQKDRRELPQRCLGIKLAKTVWKNSVLINLSGKVGKDMDHFIENRVIE